MSTEKQGWLAQAQFCSTDDYFGYDSDDEPDLKYGDLAPLQEAAKEGDLEKVKELTSQSHGFTSDIDENNFRRYCPINLAAEFKHWDVVKHLVEQKAEINNYTTDDYHINPLFHSLLDGNLEMSKYLLEHKADPYAYDPNKNNLLILALQCRNDEHFDLLLDSGIDVNITAKPHENATTYAVTNGLLSKAKELIARGGVIIPSDELLSNTVSISESPLDSIKLIAEQKVEPSPQACGLGFYQCLRSRDPSIIDVAQLLVEMAQGQGITLADVPVNLIGSYVSVLCRFDCDQVQAVLGHQNDDQPVVLTPLELSIVRKDESFIALLAPTASDETKSKAADLANRINYSSSSL